MNRNRVTFTVQGNGPFPIDMLRAERCWPHTSTDAVAITSTLNGYGGTWSLRLETLQEDPQWQPTAERWESFGWTVSGSSVA